MTQERVIVQTPDSIYDQLTATIRAEAIAEVIAHIEAWRDGLDDSDYRDGADDAVVTAQELLS